VHRDLHPLRHDATIVQNSEFDTLRLMRNTLDGKNSLLQGEGGSSKTRSTLRLLLALHRAGKTFAMCATTGAACAAFTANALETLERWRKRADWGRRCGIAGLRKRGGGGGHKQEAAAAAAPEGKSSATDALYASVAARKHKRKHTSIAAAVAAAPAAAAADGDDSARAEQQLITKLSSCQTVHSFAGIGAKTTLAGLTAKLDKYQETNPGKVPKALQKLLHTDVMLLDEVSMAGVSMLRKADLHFRRARALIDPRNADLPLGGVQVVLIGDFLQVGGESRDMRCAQLRAQARLAPSPFHPHPLGSYVVFCIGVVLVDSAGGGSFCVRVGALGGARFAVCLHDSCVAPGG